MAFIISLIIIFLLAAGFCIIFLRYKKIKKLLKKAEEKLKETEAVLEIKIKARTRELEELIQGSDKIVKEKTKELQERVEELEKFQRLTVGRELKMVELKEEIKKLKTQ